MTKSPNNQDGTAKVEATMEEKQETTGLGNLGRQGSNSPLARVIDSVELFKGKRTAIIEHAGEQYRLILTKNGKLLLQK